MALFFGRGFDPRHLHQLYENSPGEFIQNPLGGTQRKSWTETAHLKRWRQTSADNCHLLGNCLNKP